MPENRLRRAWIGIGANLGDARRTVRTAIEAIAAVEGVEQCVCSALYRSAPVDADGPDFVNAVVGIDTALEPIALLAVLQAIEAGAGRERPYRNAPRTLDLDLLAHGEVCLATPALTLPHPRLHMRAFVVVPLLELDPSLELPGIGAIADYLGAVGGQRIEKILV